MKTSLTGLLVAMSGLLAAGNVSAAPFAEQVFRNGKIYTLDARSSVASAAAVMDGKFIVVGSDAAVKPLIGPKTQVVDLGGRAVIPGLNDNHSHSIAGGEEAQLVPL